MKTSLDRLKSFWNYEEIPEIPFRDLFQMNINEEVETTEGLNKRLISINDRCGVMYWKAKAGVVVPKHYHDCDQIIYLESGSFHDGSKIHQKGSRSRIVKGSSHKMEFRQDSELIVIFEKK